MSSPGFPDAAHDHARCVADALSRAEDQCAARGAQLTPLRRRVLELVWSRHAAVGAYDLLEHIHENGRRAAPLTVYRALDFLRENGLVHRVESLNAYVGCPHPESRHRAQFLICRECRQVAEIHDDGIATDLTAHAAALGFRPEQQTIEVLGLCPNCHD